MSGEFGSLLVTLIGYEARARAAGELAKTVRPKVEAMVLDRWHDEGSDRFVRDGVVVSLIKPSPYADVTQPEALCAWLESIGRDDLVVETPVILDAAAMAAVLRRLGELIEAATLPGDIAADLLRIIDVRSQPVADWHTHVSCHVVGNGMVLSPDGEVIPGVRWVTPEPRSIRVALDAATKDAARLMLVAELGDAS